MLLSKRLLIVVASIASCFIATRLTLLIWARRSIPALFQGQLATYWWISTLLGLFVVIVAVAGTIWLLRSSWAQERRQARIEQLAEVGLLAGGLAHEIRNPLGAMQTSIALLRRQTGPLKDEKLTTRLNRLERATQQLNELLTDFLAYARPSEDQSEETSLAKLIRELRDFVELDFEQARVRIEIEAPETLPTIHVDPAKLKRAILNLMINARQAMPEGGLLRLRITTLPADHVTLEVMDNGIGIAPEDQKQIFKTFFSTKKGGTGLGLPVVHRTVEDCGGTLSFTSTPGKGTTFRIVLPTARRRQSTLPLLR